jgi:hypothetical protein
MVNHGLRDPRRADPAQPHIDGPVKTLLTHYKGEDPPAMPQHALPSSTVRWLVNMYRRGGPWGQALADLVTLAFFFLLRVGEYTPAPRAKRTVPLRRKDIILFQRGARLSHNAPLETLLGADALTVRLAGQKNGLRNVHLHHVATGDPSFCPVRAAARRVHALRALPDETPISRTSSEVNRHVRGREIVAAVREAAAGDNLAAAGYDLARFGSHSLRSGGATHLKLVGCDSDLIKKLGRWSGNTYLQYIQNEVSHVMSGVSARMAVALRLHYVGPLDNT